MPKKLYLSTKDRKIAGVCGGIAEYLGIDSTAVRLVWIILTVFTAIVPGTLAYLLAWAVMPKKR